MSITPRFPILEGRLLDTGFIINHREKKQYTHQHLMGQWSFVEESLGNVSAHLPPFSFVLIPDTVICLLLILCPDLLTDRQENVECVYILYLSPVVEARYITQNRVTTALLRCYAKISQKIPRNLNQSSS